MIAFGTSPHTDSGFARNEERPPSAIPADMGANQRAYRLVPDRLWSGVVALVVPISAAYFTAAWLATVLIARGWPEWLYLLFFLCLWNAGKFVFFVPIEALRVLIHPSRRAASMARARSTRRHAAQRYRA